MTKQRRILSFFGRENNTNEEQRPQSGNTDNEEKSTDNDEIEPEAKEANTA